MAIFQPFMGFRPRIDLAERIASKPYDVLNSAEARVEAAGNDDSFLHVVKSEIDLPVDLDHYDPQVYAKARENLDRLIDLGKLVQDDSECFYFYQQEMDGREQTGIIGCAAVSDYVEDVIKKHEHTRADKENDRIRHVDTTNANTGPVFLTYRSSERIDRIVADWMDAHQPVYNFTADGVRHTVWVCDDAKANQELVQAFARIKNLYVADGHHRSASAAKVGQLRREANPDHTGKEEYNRFLAVCFPSEQLHIMDYNRVIMDLGGRDTTTFLADLEQAGFSVEQRGELGDPYHPESKGTFGLYIDKRWYKLSAKPEIVPADAVGKLDVAVLQKQVLAGMLGIEDPRTDSRIDFVGGIRGLGELERRVEEGDGICAISMFPTSIDDLMAVADAGKVMPPKSTWFEPKLRSGLMVHRLS